MFGSLYGRRRLREMRMDVVQATSNITAIGARAARVRLCLTDTRYASTVSASHGWKGVLLMDGLPWGLWHHRLSRNREHLKDTQVVTFEL